MTAPMIVWFRRDLRLSDQPALAAAVASGAPIIPVYILDDDTPKHRKMGAASRWWLHHSLTALDSDLRALGSRLILREGKSDEILCALAEETKAAAVHGDHQEDGDDGQQHAVGDLRRQNDRQRIEAHQRDARPDGEDGHGDEAEDRPLRWLAGEFADGIGGGHRRGDGRA